MPAPDRRDDDRPHRVLAQQPDRPLAEHVRVVDEDLVDDPDVGLPHEAPQHRDHEAGHDPGREHERSHQPLAAHRAVEQQRDREAQRERQPDRPERCRRSCSSTAPKKPSRSGLARVEEDPAVVLQPGPGSVEEPAEGEGVEPLEGEQEARHGRQQVHEHHERDRGRDQPVGEPPAGALRAAAAARPPRPGGEYPGGVGLWGRLKGRRCHYPADWASSPSASFAAASSWDFTVASL